MGVLDKTYIDGKEYPVYRQWWIENYSKMVKELGDAIYLYPFAVYDAEIEITPEFLTENTEDLEEFKNRYDFPVWNTTEAEDKWLIKNCNIQSFRNRMVQVYPQNWKGFKGQKWLPKPRKKLKYVR